MWKVVEENKSSSSFGGISSLIAQKTHEETIYRIPYYKSLHVMCDKEESLQVLAHMWR
jgi:hypothetical protein